ncbi:MAG: hypothetical protein JXK93_01115 [Sphaerochaetaceae bacterium]|nr:hypothetical protein [Sphaerochaetaceae bacterium]
MKIIGFYSQKNLSLLFESGIHFTLPVMKNITRVKKYIDHDREDLELPQNILISDQRSSVYWITHRTKLDDKRMRTKGTVSNESIVFTNTYKPPDTCRIWSPLIQ